MSRLRSGVPQARRLNPAEGGKDHVDRERFGAARGYGSREVKEGGLGFECRREVNGVGRTLAGHEVRGARVAAGRKGFAGGIGLRGEGGVKGGGELGGVCAGR
jgi:hypothetical protein